MSPAEETAGSDGAAEQGERLTRLEAEALEGRDLDIAVARYVIGMHVERITPAWYGREVTLFFRPGNPLVEYSYDEHSCNAMMFRNGVDPSDGTARPLPLYSEEMDDAWSLRHWLAERGVWLTLQSDWHMRQWNAAIHRKSEFVAQSGFVDDAPLAICRAALLSCPRELDTTLRPYSPAGS
jgi:hypothetical protein